MYFSYQDIYSILEATGIAGLFNKIYVSSEFNKTKADGKIYNVVTNDLGVKPCNILHIGDNIHSDVRMAEDNGFKCIYYNNKENIARKNKLEQQVLGQMHKKYIEDALLITEKSVTFCDYIQNYFSFDIINFVYDLSKKMHKEGIQKAFFMERDGVLYGKIYRELSKKLLILDKLPEIECVNLKLSRKDTALLVNLEEIKDVIERAYKVNPPTRFHIIHILGCFGINLSDFSIKMQRQIVNHNSDSSYFEKIYFEYIYPLLLRKKNNVVSYLDKMGFFSVERVAMVDIGWGGTSQCDIEFYLSHNYERHICYGFYYACDDRARILAPYYSQYHYGPDLYYAYSLLEFIVKEYTSDLSDLKDKSERKPFLAETYKLNYDSRVQIYSDIDRFVKAVNQLQLTPEQIRQVTYPRLKSIIDNPPEEFVLLVKEAQYSLDRKNNDEYMPLLKKVEVLNELDQQYEKAQWVQASLVSSGKIINRLVLMKNCYFSIIFNPSTPRIIKKIIIFFGHHLKKDLDRYGFY